MLMLLGLAHQMGFVLIPPLSLNIATVPPLELSEIYLAYCKI